MKLNHDCIRSILLTLEDNLSYDDSLMVQEISLDHLCSYPLMKAYSRIDVFYSAEKLSEAGFIDFNPRYADDTMFEAYFEGITYIGHQYLDSIRQNDVWKKVKSALTSSGGSLAFSVIQSLGTAAIMSQFGL